MITTLAEAVAGLAMLYIGGTWLVRGASELATRLGISGLAVGLTVVAFGTSAPELVVSVDAALSGAADISVGNVVGSNIANIGLILGLAALVRPMAVEAKIVRVDAPLTIAVSLVLLSVMADARISRLEGAVLLLGLVVYTGFTLWQARRQAEPTPEELTSKAPSAPAGTPVSMARIVIGFVLLIAGGHLLVTSAVEIASFLEISQAAIGLTIVAVGTSLPELSTSLVASVRGRGDIAIGNVLGSNIFNVLGILGVTASAHPTRAGAITIYDLGTMIIFSAVIAVLLSTRLRLDRLEGAALLCGYILYTAWLLAT